MDEKPLLQHGDVVFIHHPLFNCQGYVYEEYPDFEKAGKNGVSIVTEKRTDTGGWSYTKQQEHLEFICHSDFYYQFENQGKLYSDLHNGIFDKIFLNSR